jgi:thiol-disulfide isomerase/thioredoxin
MRGLLLGLLLAGCGAGEPAPDPTPAPTVEPASTPTPTPAPAATPEVEAVTEAWTAPVITALPDPSTIADSAKGLSNGDFAPELDLFDLAHGENYRLSDHVGPTATDPAKVVIVGFAASWCGRCKLSYPYLAEMQKQFGDDLHVVFITTDESEPLMKKEVDLIKKGGLDVPVLKPDAHTLTAWLGRKRNIPHFYIVNTAGEILVQDRGFGDKVKKVLPGQIRYALNHPEYVRRR